MQRERLRLQPATAVFNASKIPMTCLQLVHWPGEKCGRRPSSDTLQQATCQEFFFANSVSYGFDPIRLPGQICREPAEIAGPPRRVRTDRDRRSPRERL